MGKCLRHQQITFESTIVHCCPAKYWLREKDVSTVLRRFISNVVNELNNKMIKRKYISLSPLQSAYLEVVIPPDIIYEETSGDLMVPEGGSAKLVCKARGYPKPEIVWRREDRGDIISRDTTGGPKTRREKISTIFKQSQNSIPLTFYTRFL